LKESFVLGVEEFVLVARQSKYLNLKVGLDALALSVTVQGF